MILLLNKNYLTKWMVPFYRNDMSYISIFPYILWIFLVYIVVFSAMAPDIDAQLLSGQRRNDSTATGLAARQDSSGNSLLSLLQGPGILSGNLSSSIEQGLDTRLQSIADSMFKGVEEEVDARVESIKSRLDEVAAVAVPVIIAAVAGIVILGVLIGVYIVISWFDRFEEIRNHKKALRNIYGLILGELNGNAELVKQRMSLTKSFGIQNEGEDQNNQSEPELLSPDDLSTQALEAAMASPYYWNLTSEIQHVMVKLFRALNDHNKVFGRALGLRDSIIINKTHKQTTEKLLADYESALNKYNQDINLLSKQLQELIQTEMSKGVLGVFRTKHKDDEGHS
jgi:ABC-type multidrug transport system fused ATPase/permease subunit